jgi:hypothetical protein
VAQLINDFLNLDQTYGQTFPTIRSLMWVGLALLLWALIWKFSHIPGNGGKYIWELVLIPFAFIFTILPIVDYFKGLGNMWAELLFIPGFASLICLAIVWIKLSRPKYSPIFASAMDLASRTLTVALEAEAAARAAKIAADVAVEAAEHASTVARSARKAALIVEQTAASVAKDVAAEAAFHAAKVVTDAEVAATEVTTTATASNSKPAGRLD